MHQIVSRWLADIITKRWLALFIVLSLTALSLATRISPTAIISLWKPGEITKPQPQQTAKLRVAEPDNPQPAIPNVETVSLTDADLMLVVEAEDFFTSKNAQAIKAVVQGLQELDQVRDIFWLENVPVLNLFGLRETVLPNEKASQRQFERAREQALGHPLIGGQLISPDGKVLLLLIKLDWLYVTDDRQCTDEIRARAEKIAGQFSDANLQFNLTGRLPMYLTFVNSQLKNRWTYQIIGYAMVALMALILFRGLRAVIIVATAACLGVFWTMSLLILFELNDNPFNDIVLPILISLIALTDGVHLLVEIRRQMGQGLTAVDAARRGVEKVGLACALTSITTAIGFGSLAFAHNDLVQDFGSACVFGVGLSFLSVLVIIPLACSSRLGRDLHLGANKGIIDRHLHLFSGLIDAVLRRSRLFAAIALTSSLILLAISLQLEPDEKRSNALPVHSEVSQAIALLDTAMGGMEQSSVGVTWNRDEALADGKILDLLEEIHQLLSQQELIGHALSLKKFVDVLPGGGTTAERMLLVDLLPAELKRAFYVPEKRSATVDFRVQDLGIARYGPVFTAIEQELLKIEQKYPGVDLELRGSAVSRWKNLYQIVVDLALSLGSALFIIFIVLTLAYQSLRIGLISLVPNLFPLAVTGTFLVITGEALELASVCAFTICLGIAVDDTIHFLTRFQEELPGRTIDEALVRAFTATGTALLMTSIILVIGFVTVIMSDLRDQRIFGTMGAITISSALFADLVFLPALLKVFVKSRPSEID